MSRIRIKLTREKNQIIELDFEEYVFGVVASEMGNYELEALKAQAVAARTVALPYLLDNKVISDTGVQAFRRDKMDERDFENARQAAR